MCRQFPERTFHALLGPLYIHSSVIPFNLFTQTYSYEVINVMKRIFWVCLLIFGFILNCSMVLAADVYVESSGSCGGKTPCYSTIQEAVNAANSGDTIKLAQGIYAETFVLSSGKQLITEGGWDAGFTTQTPRTTSIRAPVVPNGAIAFQELRIMEIAGSMGNASIADVLYGRTFSSDAGTGLTGTMPNLGGLNYTPTTTDQPIVAGYYNGSGKVAGDVNLSSNNIMNGVTIFGVTGTFPSDGTAVAGDVKTGSTFYTTSDTKLIGNGTKELSAANDTVTAGYYAATTLSTVDKDLIAGNIICGETIFGVTGSIRQYVAKTGQTVSYGTGDDAAHRNGGLPVVAPVSGINFGNYNRTSLACSSAGFTDNGNGTVTDNLTGLVWLKNANCTDTAGGVVKADGDLDWADALAWCNALESGLCGLTDGSSAGDWRLPNINELRSLFDPSLDYPFLPAGHPFTGVQSYYYWASTTYAYYTTGAWYVRLFNGVVNGDDKTGTHCVWPVRGGQ